MNSRVGILGAGLALLALVFAPNAAADAERGKILYETHCNACHASSVHNRKARKAKSFAGLRAQVQRWSTEAGSGWSADEIDSVTLYLNLRFYRFSCPENVCRAAPGSSSG